MSTRKEWSLLNKIAALVIQKPGLTGAELSKELGQPGAYRRLSEVKKLGLVKKGAKRECTVSFKTADTWFPDDSPAKVEVDRGETPKQAVKRLEDRVEFLVNENARLSRWLKALDEIGSLHFDWHDLEDDEMTLQQITGNVNDRVYTEIAKGAKFTDALRKLCREK